ncbi:hypothetical protein B0T26DRAFT_677724 [Lasiosphaeria miniovina]|uniref:Uncharacterized protein n=1 Tax=Lasiosphaeria miniovina TaxID=1954250 RepID=A0AA40ACQ3_9PEZI|nr:uncharacterized protein B0T26DRAFT_677724 [Lasiosphaeria miniovina]KAK0713380.1 hypothetical protein B0T26DRAFT_677724 [Lasiosphaeria miniovina]
MSMEEPMYLTKNHLECCERGSVHEACDMPRVPIIFTYPVSCLRCKERWVLKQSEKVLSSRCFNRLLMNLFATEPVVQATWEAELLSLIPVKAGSAPYLVPRTQTLNYRAFTAIFRMLARRVPEVRKAETFLAVTDMQDERTVDDALKWEYGYYKAFLRRMTLF